MAEEQPDLRAEIERLRELLAELGQRHAEELGLLRNSLNALEQRLAEEKLKDESAAKLLMPGPEAAEPPAVPPPLPAEATKPESPGDEESGPPREETVEESPSLRLPPAISAPLRLSPRSDVPPKVEAKVEKFRERLPVPRMVHQAEPEPEPEPQAAPMAPAAPPPAKAKGSLEMRMGQVWFVRIGIALLVTGLVLLGNYAYQNWIRDLPAGARLACLYVGSFALSGTGIWVGRREGMRRFGEVVLAGGLAFFYWCTYAAHHVGRLKVIDSPVLAAVLLLVAAGVMVGVSLKRDSRATAVLGLLLASYSTVLQPLGWLSAVSNLVLAGAGMALMLRPGWAAPGVATMVGSYGAFLWWQIAGAARGTPDDPAALWFLPPVWAVFALPGLLGHYRESLSERARAWLTGSNNVVFFGLYTLLWLSQRGGDDYWRVPAVFGLVQLFLGIIGRRQDSTAGGVHLMQGLAALMFATVLKLEGYQLALGLAGEALALACAFHRFRGRSELVFALLTGAAAVLASFFDVRALDLFIAGAEPPLWSSGLVALILAAAAVVMRRASDRAEGEVKGVARATCGIDLIGGALVAAALWCPKLADPWPAPMAALLAIGAAAGLSVGGKQPWLRELLAVTGVFVVSSLVQIAGDPGSAATGVSVLLLAFLPALFVQALRRFSNPVELVASLLVMAVVGLATLVDVTRDLAQSGGELVPTWSVWLVALIFAASGVWLRRVCDALEGKVRQPARNAVLLMLIAGSVVALGAGISRLDAAWQQPVAAVIALVLSAATLLGDRKRWIPELGWVSVLFAAAGACLLLGSAPPWSALTGMGLAGVACWLWHRDLPQASEDSGAVPDPVSLAAIPAWLNAAIVPVALLEYWSRIELPAGKYPFWAGLAALLLVAAGAGLRCRRLAATGMLLHLVGLLALLDWPGEGLVAEGFETTMLALGTLALWLVPSVRTRWEELSSVVVMVISRGVAFFGWLLAWYHFSDRHWIDVIALSAVAVGLLALRHKAGRQGATIFPRGFDPILHPEAWGFLAVAVVVSIMKGVAAPWHDIGEAANWQRWAVAPAVFSCASVLRRTGKMPARSLAALFLFGAVLLAGWATHMLVWRHGWQGVAVLWTLFGFGYVTVGLWQRLAVLRQAGFALLAMALLKLFISDVWNFEAFIRVAAFLALGVALVLLGFFYNRFAEVLKRLLEQEEE